MPFFMRGCYVNLMGGLGNQLFQVAAGYGYSRRYGKNLCLNAERWAASQGQNPHRYQNSLFKNFKYASPIGEVFYYTEEKFNYTKIPYVMGDVSLTGYFQSLKYLGDYKEEFIKKLNLPNVNTGWVKGKNVAAHIRRGDYLQHAREHFVCDTNYYLKCMEQFKDHQINVFTDSPELVQKEFEGYQHFNIIKTGDELMDLTLMSQHDNLIGSNSSFSWWGSLLGKEKKRILMPDKWFGDAFADGYEDVYREEFERIDV